MAGSYVLVSGPVGFLGKEVTTRDFIPFKGVKFPDGAARTARREKGTHGVRKRKISHLAAGLALSGWTVCLTKGTDDVTAHQGVFIVVMSDASVALYRQGCDVPIGTLPADAELPSVLKAAERAART